MLTIEAREEVWLLKHPFRISRGSRTEAQVVFVTVSDGEHAGRGECVPIARYNQSTQSVIAQIESIKDEKRLDRQHLQKLLPAGAARNALDGALWDLQTKMAAAASANTTAPVLKLKLGGDDLDLARVEAVRQAAPAARLLIDANESWSAEHYEEIVPALKELGVALIEQPFPADADEVLQTLDHPIPVCADESCHTSADLLRLTNRYETINVKLDKTGGLTEALHLCECARESGFKVMIGCMVCTSLGIAPARLLATFAEWIDLDGPLLLASDREHGLAYRNGKIEMPSRELWG